jgi:hypothetical protein
MNRTAETTGKEGRKGDSTVARREDCEGLPEADLDEPAHVVLTIRANRPRLRRDAERSRGSEWMRENGGHCRRGPS